jgi:hypothetical protein
VIQIVAAARREGAEKEKANHEDLKEASAFASSA